MEATPTTVRNAELSDLVTMLKTQGDVKVDVVTDFTNLRSENAILKVKGLRVFGDADVRPTAIMDGHIADRLGIPVKYVRRMRIERPDLYDVNFNGWVHAVSPTAELFAPDAKPDQRKVLLRTFLGIEGEGIGRALLSDTYAPIDNLDVLMAALSGAQASGTNCEVVSANLSETRMTVRLACPEISALAPTLLENYRSPTSGWNLDTLSRNYSPEHLGWDASKGELPPVTFAGFEVSNSETGGSAFTITPVITVLACKNGIKINAMQVRKIHLGSKLEEGVIKYSDDTRRKNIELIAAETRDTVATFVSEEFLTAQVAQIEAKAGKPVDDAAKTIEFVAKELVFTDEEQAGILNHFIRGGQMTAGGVLNAVTSFAQTVESPDAAFELESKALKTLDLVSA